MATTWYAQAEHSGANDGSESDPWKDYASISGLSSGDAVNLTGLFRENFPFTNGVTYQQWANHAQWWTAGSDIFSAWSGPDSDVEYYTTGTVATEPHLLFADDVQKEKATVGSLSATQWGWGDKGDGNRIYLGWDPSGETIEAAQRPYCFNSGAYNNITVIKAFATHGNNICFSDASRTSSTIIYQNCETYQSRYNGFMAYDQQGGNVQFENCVGHQVLQYSTGSYSFNSANASGGICEFINCQNVNAPYRSILIENQSGGTILFDGCDVSSSTSHNVYLTIITGGTLTVKNSKVHDGSSAGVMLNAADGSLADIRVEHNVLYGHDVALRDIYLNNADSVVISRNSCYSAQGGCEIDAGSTGNTIKNNVFHRTTAFPTYYIKEGCQIGLLSDYNDVYNTGGNLVRYRGIDYATLAAYQSASNQDLNSISADPLFIDATNDNFRLLATSPCIDAGTFIGSAPTTDPDGNSTQVGAYPDIGAYEYQLTAYEAPSTPITLDWVTLTALYNDSTGTSVDTGYGIHGFLISYRKGSEASMQVKLEQSNNGTDWYSLVTEAGVDASQVSTLSTTGDYYVCISNLAYDNVTYGPLPPGIRYVRAKAKATTPGTAPGVVRVKVVAAPKYPVLA